MLKSLSKVLVLATALAVIPSTVKADPDPPGDCFSAAAFPGMTPFTYCWGGFAGNDDKTTLVDLLNDKVGPGWTWGGKTGEADDPFSAWTPATIGKLTFEVPVTTSFAISLKAGPNYAVYYYAMPFNQSGLYGSSINGTTNKPPLPDFVNFNTNGVSETRVNALSHASLLLGPSNTVVPEPSTFILLGTGLLMLFGVERRRRKA